MMLATYSDTAGAADFDVGELINSLIPTNSLPSGLKITLNSAVMAYLADNASKFVFAIDVGNGINLANLPLVGKLFPKGKTIRLSYQIQYVSADFNSSDITAINPLLPVGVNPLPNGGMSKGLGLAVSMQFAEDIILFDLDLTTSGAEDDPNVGSYGTNADGTKAIPSGQAPVVRKTPDSPIRSNGSMSRKVSVRCTLSVLVRPTKEGY